MGTHGAVVRRTLEGNLGLVERSVFGMSDPVVIVGAVDAFCRTHLGAPIDRYTFYRSSIASVHGLVLADGRRVVVKAHQPEIALGHLKAMGSVQRQLAGAGFPCPSPLIPPQRLVYGWATAEEELATGEPADGHDPRIRKEMARSLAKLLQLCRPLGAPDGVPIDRQLLVPHGRLWPVPHARIFDFDATGAGAEQIDEVAAAARNILDGVELDDLILGHTDWRAENVRFDGDRLSAVYDWESLLRTIEPVLVGAVAHAFPSDWSQPISGSQAASLEEVRAFVAEYEEARGGPFRERALLGAGYAYATAYTARCEHALDPERTSEPREGFRTLIDEHGIALLDVFLTG
jgi:hypothetical protein